MNILIVDDQYDGKIKSIARKIRELDSCKIDIVNNARDAYIKMTEICYDLLLLDLQIPDVLGDDINIHGGVDLLELMSSCQDANIPSNIVGITSHSDAYNDDIGYFNSHGWTIHLYDGSNDFIHELIDNKFRNVKSNIQFDVAFITALRHVEFEALLNNGYEWSELQSDDCNKYYTTTFLDKNGIKRTAIATYCTSMGMPTSAAISMKIILKFKPKLLIMTGISAGIEGKVNLGDILIPNSVWDWGNGKIINNNNGSKLLSDPETIKINEKLVNDMKDISSNGLYVDEIKRKFQGNVPSNSLSIHVGPLASGAAVVADLNTIELIKNQKRTVIGIEMEACGVLIASNLSGSEITKTLIIKSACDFADGNKNNDWQKYAAYTSTAVAKKIIENIIDFNK